MSFLEPDMQSMSQANCISPSPQFSTFSSITQYQYLFHQFSTTISIQILFNGEISIYIAIKTDFI